MDGCFWEGTLGDQPFTTTNKGGKIFRGASSEAPFSRLCLMFPYKDGELLQSLLEAMDAINHRTLSVRCPAHSSATSCRLKRVKPRLCW